MSIIKSHQIFVPWYSVEGDVIMSRHVSCAAWSILVLEIRLTLLPFPRLRLLHFSAGAFLRLSQTVKAIIEK
jgi:hypothetical protein